MLSVVQRCADAWRLHFLSDLLLLLFMLLLIKHASSGALHIGPAHE